MMTPDDVYKQVVEMRAQMASNREAVEWCVKVTYFLIAAVSLQIVAKFVIWSQIADMLRRVSSLLRLSETNAMVGETQKACVATAINDASADIKRSVHHATVQVNEKVTDLGSVAKTTAELAREQAERMLKVVQTMVPPPPYPPHTHSTPTPAPSTMVETGTPSTRITTTTTVTDLPAEDRPSHLT